MNRLLRHVPVHIKDSKAFKEIMKVEGIELGKLDFNLKDLEKQLLVKTATWALAIYEKELGLPINPDIDISVRRALISARMLMRPPSNKVQLVEIIKGFIETAEIEEHYSEYKFDVVLKTLDTVGDKLPYINDVVEKFKPAHLEYMFIICYLYYPKLYTEFKRHFSSKLKTCGTIDVNGCRYYSTNGKSYLEEFNYKHYGWVTLKLPTVFGSRTINNKGMTYKGKFAYDHKLWLSTAFSNASNNMKIESVGSTHASKFKYNYNKWLSVELRRAVRSLGLSCKDNLRLGSNSSLSKELKVCSENTYTKEVTT